MRTISSATDRASVLVGSDGWGRSVRPARSSPYGSSYAFSRIASDGLPALAKWLVPEVKAPGTTMAVSTPPGGGAAHPQQQPRALGAKVRQSGAADPLCSQDVDVVDGCEVLGRERLGGAEDHVPRVVDDDVEAAVPVEDGADGQVGGLLQGGDGGRVAVGGSSHPGEDGVPGPCQGHGREPAEPAGGPGDEDDTSVIASTAPLLAAYGP